MLNLCTTRICLHGTKLKNFKFYMQIYIFISECFFCQVVGGVVLPLCGEDKDYRELLHGRLWLSARQAGEGSSSTLCHFSCFCFDYF